MDPQEQEFKPEDLLRPEFRVVETELPTNDKSQSEAQSEETTSEIPEQSSEEVER